ncbi:hypothetical protein [Tsuneonella aeria]|uniref:hypothetical protein n=1 Tax=Tsuneonella aeria TaxID=1837929 RepID=UPI00136962FE|nr:hypothetical protein [Tsuneonella aeria]
MSVPWLSIVMPRTEFDALRKKKGWKIPANLPLRFEPRANPDLPPIASDVAGQIRYFAQTELSSIPPRIWRASMPSSCAMVASL